MGAKWFKTTVFTMVWGSVATLLMSTRTTTRPKNHRKTYHLVGHLGTCGVRYKDKVLENCNFYNGFGASTCWVLVLGCRAKLAKNNDLNIEDLSRRCLPRPFTKFKKKKSEAQFRSCLIQTRSILASDFWVDLFWKSIRKYSSRSYS